MIPWQHRRRNTTKYFRGTWRTLVLGFVFFFLLLMSTFFLFEGESCKSSNVVLQGHICSSDQPLSQQQLRHVSGGSDPEGGGGDPHGQSTLPGHGEQVNHPPTPPPHTLLCLIQSGQQIPGRIGHRACYLWLPLLEDPGKSASVKARKTFM